MRCHLETNILPPTEKNREDNRHRGGQRDGESEGELLHVQFASESDAVISANGTADVETDEREKHAAFVLREMFV